MIRLLLASTTALLLLSTPAQAEKFGFCEDTVKSGTECFLVMAQETYRKCRIVQSMMIIEYGFLESYLPDNNGEKLNFCIDKHRRGIQLPYQAALKELTKRKNAREALAALYHAWLSNIEALIPAMVETQEAYESRVNGATEELLANVSHVHSTLASEIVTAEKPKRSAPAGKRKRQ